MNTTLDNKHGVNPSIETCFICGEDKGLILWGQLRSRQVEAFKAAGIPMPSHGEAPRRLTLNEEPCTKCEEHMKQGIILISVDEGKTEDMRNPYRSGGWCVVTEEAVRRIVQPEELMNDILKKRVAFIPDDAWDIIGLPRAPLGEHASGA